MERLRCNTCGAYFSAPLPDDVFAGASQQQYGYSAGSLTAIYKYFAGLPFYRQCSIQKLQGVKLPLQRSLIKLSWFVMIFTQCTSSFLI
ncbi:hypothetical protein [Shewanella sp. SR43-8]|uniref:hypothetical protein n=1 Tax=Shewanella sp. SR43-8 TaxID=2760938 RepID=UPI001C726D50|nr:hypothetical protein [Shewanella sp. SR43-8]